MPSLKYVILSFILFTTVSQAQNNNNLIQQTDSIYNIYKKTNPTEGIKVLNVLIKQQDTLMPSEGIANIYHRKGLLYEKLARTTKSNLYNNKAIAEYKIAIETRQSVTPVNLKKINNSLYNTSNCYNRLGQIRKKREALETIINSKTTDKFIYKAYGKLAYTHVSFGDYYTALQYLNKVIHSYSIHNNIKTLYEAHITAIYIYSIKNNNLNDLDKINYHKKEIDNLLKKYDQLKPIINVDNNLARIYKNLGIYDEASESYEKALSDYKKVNDSANISTTYQNLGELYSLQGQHKKADNYYNKALKIVKSNLTESGIYANQGAYLNTVKSIEKLPYFEKAIQTLLNTTTNHTFSLPTLETLKSTPNKSYALIYLTALANYLVKSYEEEQDVTYLKRAKATLYKIDQLVSLMRYDSSSDQSKLFWINKGVDLYMLAVKVSHLLNEPETAFYFMEKNKSLLLLENLNTTQETERLQIPDSTLQREFNLRYAILDTEDKLQNTPNNKTLTNVYLQQEENYTQFLDTLKAQHPSYFNTKKEPAILSLKDAKAKHISKNTSYVEYILNDTDGYGLYCDNEGTKLFKIQDTPKLLQQLESLKTLVSTPIIDKKKYEHYKTTAFSVFSKLFPFENALQRITDKKLTVIPDYKLRNLPFEALITSQNDNDILPKYLIQHTEVSYYQSTSVFKQIEQKQRTAKKELIGFAPITFSTGNLPSLLGSKAEMNTIADLVTSKLLTNTQATKTAFLSGIKDYSVIHINTHAGLDKNNEPWIAFTDAKLSLKELYGINNQANLVVLDACKSATGTIEQGEGVMSLSRGFFYSGAESVIASQWNVNEQSNNEILISFYKNLKEGETKSKALHNAKLEYLNTHQVGELSPYFWSSLILTGNPDAIEIASFNPLLLKIGIIILIILVLFFILKKMFFSRK
jgi:CHAT domain-containing protein/Tfp pilus assembly protein PilF